ncbi:MAG: type fimbrial assembly protein PilB [Verrucomicrobia bacterium]|nr:type fimbrial assembly protein PilB [Verrucomicrobiota bacterium]
MFESRDEAISELLIQQGLVRAAQLEELRQGLHTSGAAAGGQQACNPSVADTVLAKGWVERPAFFAAIARATGVQLLPGAVGEIDAATTGLLTAELARNYRAVPWRSDGGIVDVLAADPFDPGVAPDLAFALGHCVRIWFDDPDKTERLLERSYGLQREKAGSRAGGGVVELDPEISTADLESMAGQPPVVQFVESVLSRAVLDRASDIHFEPFAREFKVRCRVDGVLHEVPPPPTEMALPIASRIKVLAGLDIAERRLPQDGRLRFAAGQRAVDLRVSTLPTQCGESIVLRVLDQSAVGLELAKLGMPRDVMAGVREAIRRPHGIFIVTGPTGSGKTTTLYSALREINSLESKLLTVEDPVEYGIDGIMQVSVNPPAGLTFASAMRAFLRQDPDVIMVGEIRDPETAQTAIQAALTGHLVMTTLHTNDAPGAITRLLDMGVESFLLAATVEGVLAQRLMRRVCQACREPEEIPEKTVGGCGIKIEATAGGHFFRGRGCAACGQTGYRGRIGIYEWLPLTGSMRELITANAPVLAMKARAREEGMRRLRDEALRAALAGETTFEEVLRHT